MEREIREREGFFPLTCLLRAQHCVCLGGGWGVEQACVFPLLCLGPWLPKLSKVREVECLNGPSKENSGATGNGNGDSVVGHLPFKFELKVSWHDSGKNILQPQMKWSSSV